MYNIIIHTIFAHLKKNYLFVVLFLLLALYIVRGSKVFLYILQFLNIHEFRNINIAYHFVHSFFNYFKAGHL